jgi:hypothetical protein
MRFMCQSALKDLRRMRHDPLSLATWVGTPLMVFLLLVAFFGREQLKPQGLNCSGWGQETEFRNELSRKRHGKTRYGQ